MRMCSGFAKSSRCCVRFRPAQRFPCSFFFEVEPHGDMSETLERMEEIAEAEGREGHWHDREYDPATGREDWEDYRKRRRGGIRVSRFLSTGSGFNKRKAVARSIRSIFTAALRARKGRGRKRPGGGRIWGISQREPGREADLLCQPLRESSGGEPALEGAGRLCLRRGTGGLADTAPAGRRASGPRLTTSRDTRRDIRAGGRTGRLFAAGFRIFEDFALVIADHDFFVVVIQDVSGIDRHFAAAAGGIDDILRHARSRSCGRAILR